MGGEGSGRKPDLVKVMNTGAPALANVTTGNAFLIPNLSGVQPAVKKGANNPLDASKVVVTDANKQLASSGDATFAGTLTINKDTNDKALIINSQATTAGNFGLEVVTGQGAAGVQVQYGTNNDSGRVQLCNNPATSSSGGSMDFYRNLAAAATARPLVTIRQDNASDDQNALTVQQDGTGTGITIDQNADAKGLIIDSEATTATNWGIEVETGQGAGTANFKETANCYVQLRNGSSASSSLFYRNLASANTTGPVVKITQDNTGDDQPCLTIQQDGDAEAMVIDQNDNDSAFIDFQGTSAADATKNISTWTNATIAGYVKVEINGTAYWMPYYNAPTS